MIIKTNEIDIKLTDMNINNAYYFKKEKLSIEINNNFLIITDITNALGWGKTCLKVALKFKIGITENTLKNIQEILDKYKLGFNDLLEEAVLNLIKIELKALHDLKCEFISEMRKGVWTYSPFVKIDKKKAYIPPKRFGRYQLIKMLLSGKIKTSDEVIKSIVETPSKKQKTKLYDDTVITFKAKDIFVEFLIEIEKPEVKKVA
ncbi:hypothetical protein [Dethiothermospora halolimnae]|uniref:hypothetical protein n=1 Tax=Dethiothermospora halolimnae TaxID=3114390 RepID=UPI003CCC3DF3